MEGRTNTGLPVCKAGHACGCSAGALVHMPSIAWLMPWQARAHRVVASVVICTELILVFIVYVVTSQAMSLTNLAR